jgi:hypothetical protein
MGRIPNTDWRLALMSPDDQHTWREKQHAREREQARQEQWTTHRKRVDAWKECCARMKVDAIRKGDDPRSLTFPQPPHPPRFIY